MPPSVPSRDCCIQRALGVFDDDLLDAHEPCVIVGMQIDAENAGHQDAVSQFETAHLHVAEEFVDDDLTADTGLRWFGSALHAGPLFGRANLWYGCRPPARLSAAMDAERTLDDTPI